MEADRLRRQEEEREIKMKAVPVPTSPPGQAGTDAVRGRGAKGRLMKIERDPLRLPLCCPLCPVQQPTGPKGPTLYPPPPPPHIGGSGRKRL